MGNMAILEKKENRGNLAVAFDIINAIVVYNIEKLCFPIIAQPL